MGIVSASLMREVKVRKTIGLYFFVFAIRLSRLKVNFISEKSPNPDKEQNERREARDIETGTHRRNEQKEEEEEKTFRTTNGYRFIIIFRVVVGTSLERYK